MNVNGVIMEDNNFKTLQGGIDKNKSTIVTQQMHDPDGDGVGPLSIFAEPCQGITAQGSKTVPISIAEIIGEDLRCSSIMLISDSGGLSNDNTDVVFIGNVNVTIETGFPIRPGSIFGIDVDNVADIYCISSSSGQILRWIALD